MMIATRGADMTVSDDACAEGGSTVECVQATRADDGAGSTPPAFLSSRSGLGSAKLSFCRLPGKHIPGIFSQRRDTAVCEDREATTGRGGACTRRGTVYAATAGEGVQSTT